MTLADVKPGGWIDHEVLTHAQMNAIRTELLKAVDGAGGGTYNPSANLIFGGAGELQIDNVLRVLTGADLFVDAGAGLEVNASSEFNAQADFSGNVDFFADVDFRAGSTVEFFSGATVEFASLAALDVDAVLQTMRLPLTPIYYVNVQPGFSPVDVAWTFSPLGAGGWVNVALDTVSFGASQALMFALPVNAGDTIDTLRVVVGGGIGAGHGGVDPTNKMRVRILESPSSSGVYTAIATLSDPATGAAYDADHTITLVPSYVALNRQYVIEIVPEFGGTAAAFENCVYSISVDVIRRTLVSTNTFGA